MFAVEWRCPANWSSGSIILSEGLGDGPLGNVLGPCNPSGMCEHSAILETETASALIFSSSFAAMRKTCHSFTNHRLSRFRYNRPRQPKTLAKRSNSGNEVQGQTAMAQFFFHLPVGQKLLAVYEVKSNKILSRATWWDCRSVPYLLTC